MFTEIQSLSDFLDTHSFRHRTDDSCFQGVRVGAPLHTVVGMK